MKQNWKGIYSYGTVGLELNVSVLLGLFGGRWLDKKLSTSPWFTLTLTALGVCVAAYSLYKVAVRANEEDERRAAEEEKRLQDYHDDRE